MCIYKYHWKMSVRNVMYIYMYAMRVWLIMKNYVYTYVCYEKLKWWFAKPHILHSGHTRVHTHTHTHTQNAYVHQSLGMWMLYQEKLYEHIYEISYSYKLPMYNGPIRYVHNVVAERVMMVSNVYALILLE